MLYLIFLLKGHHFFFLLFFFFNDTATSYIYTLSLHDALPISAYRAAGPDWDRNFPTIVLTGADAKFRRGPPRVHIAVGRPGLDHDATEHFVPTGTLARSRAEHKSQAISVAQAIGQIALALVR